MKSDDTPWITPQVRDLAWACFSPPLLQVETLGYSAGPAELILTRERRQWLSRLDREPAALLDSLAQNPARRLGLYYEQLWHFFLTQDPDLELIAHNLPVRTRNSTVGEFDCLYYCHQRERYFHLELAVKFYLGHRTHTTTETDSQWREWLGANTVDRLERKLDRLLKHQIRLGQHPLAREILADLGIENPGREIALRGALFQPAADALPAPLGYNPMVPMQYWYTLAHWQQQADPHATYALPDRLLWLSALCSQRPLGAAAITQHLTAHFAQGGHPQLVVRLNSEGHEDERYFITHAQWPAPS
ncbi:hypothetical protein CWI75_08280 [Kineobactrum sediminis]|uniref:DUF1853 domain-containing protein n=1 Tax=Kineobactrum sediminis TaxID=1905677 RepID=A0A2N5Y2G8_9GAMM|nr:DUF1853 family protein [Kineobactrum sediminis]PLW82575.1 hypothetical protein CWI75_08280 [Kineobactrum sediminis]